MLLQLQREALRAVEATRPGGCEHLTLAAIHACDAGTLAGCHAPVPAKRLAAVRKRSAPPAAAQAWARALRAARARYGRELAEAAATRLLERALERAMLGRG